MLLNFEVFDSGGAELAIAAAGNRKTIHCIVANFCLIEGHALLHRDRDFDSFGKHLGLHVIVKAALGFYCFTYGAAVGGRIAILQLAGGVVRVGWKDTVGVIRL